MSDELPQRNLQININLVTVRSSNSSVNSAKTTSKFRINQKHQNELLGEANKTVEGLEGISVHSQRDFRKNYGGIKQGNYCKKEEIPHTLTVIQPGKTSNSQNAKPVKGKVTSKGRASNNYSYSKFDDYKECFNYVRYGYCRFGIRCRYDHPDFSDEAYSDDETFDERSSASNSQPRLNKNTPLAKKDSTGPQQSKRQQPCWYFKNSGFCNKGENCEFSHIIVFKEQDVTDFKSYDLASKSSTSKIIREQCTTDESNLACKSDAAEKDTRQLPVPQQICRNFSNFGRCRFGYNCKFLHIARVTKTQENTKHKASLNRNAQKPILNPNDGLIETAVALATFDSDGNKEQQPKDEKQPGLENLEWKRKTVIKKSKPNLYIENLTDDDLQNLRQEEITLLKRRFQKKILYESDTEIELHFYPSDPDWPFAVKLLNFFITIPNDYPKETCAIQCLNKNDDLPLILMRFINKTMKEWLNERLEVTRRSKRVELVLRPFFNWFNRNMEDVFIEGLKRVKKDMEAQAAGIQFVPFEDIAEDLKANFQDSEENDSVENAPKQEEPVEVEIKVPAAHRRPNNQFPSVTQKRGTEIKLQNFELTENATTISCRKIALTVQCGRCKLRSDIITPPLRINQIVCSRCNHSQQVTYRPQLLHQFMAVLGYLDLDDCTIVDIPLMKCEFSVGCLNCNRQVDTNGLQYGQKQNLWCLYCNSKMGIKVESVKFQYIQMGAIVGGSTKLIRSSTMWQLTKNPAVQLGKPLPDNGTCKHYKKSFRWLRFPCCGKAYPCDVCHYENETDHEMKYATRMFCGLCSKEQPYTNGKECIACLSSLTKKTGTHWEGGKGCRDKLKMNSQDKQKYQGVCKTMSKKAQLALQN